MSAVDRSRHYLPIVLISAISLLIYANTLKNGFVFDDDNAIVKNTYIRELSNLPKLFTKDYFVISGEGSYRPVVTFTYFLEYAMYGLMAWGFHLTNILLHMFNSVLLYIFVTMLSEKPGSARLLGNRPLLVSILFATHPVLTEAVNAVSFREDLLAFLFYIGTLVLYIRLRARPCIAMYALSCITYSLALLSKEMAVTLPAIIWLYEWIYIEKEKRLLTIFNGYNIGYIALTLAYSGIRFYYLSGPVEVDLPPWTLPVRLQTIPLLLMGYLKLGLFPVSLSADYEFAQITSPLAPLFFIPLAGSFLILGAALISRSLDKGISLGIAMFAITLAPVSNIVRITNPFAERYAYLPAAGLILALGLALHGVSRIRAAYMVIPLFVICFYSTVSIDRSRVWRDGYSLWYDTVKKMPESFRAHYNLGYFYYKEGMVVEAVREYKTALRLKPDHYKAASNLGIIYFNEGRYPDALKVFEEILNRSPNAWFARGMVRDISKKLSGDHK